MNVLNNIVAYAKQHPKVTSGLILFVAGAVVGALLVM